MHSYRVFGGTLESAFPFTELQASDQENEWSLAVGHEPPIGPLELVGEDIVFGETKVRSYRTAEGISLIYDDTGRFDITASGQIVWYAPDGADDHLREGMRADVLGRVMAMLFHLQGVPSLHASAVSIGGEGVSFMGPKGFGKSTIAAGLARGGARVLTDDTLPIARGPAPRLRPGVTRIRLLRDSATAIELEGAHEGDDDRKLIASHFEEEVTSVRFAAAYLLSPAPADPSVPEIERELLPAPLATMALIEQSKLGSLLRGPEATAHFHQMADVASRVPVYRLRIRRDLGRLDSAVEQLKGWHASPPGVGSVP